MVAHFKPMWKSFINSEQKYGGKEFVQWDLVAKSFLVSYDNDEELPQACCADTFVGKENLQCSS